MCTPSVYSFSSLHSLALGLVTLTATWAVLSTVALQFFEEMLWAISAQWDSLHTSSTSSSLMLWTRNFQKPLGSMCFVFLLSPYPVLGVRIGPSLSCTPMPLGFPQVHLFWRISLTGARWTSWSSFWQSGFHEVSRAAVVLRRRWLPPANLYFLTPSPFHLSLQTSLHLATVRFAPLYLWICFCFVCFRFHM